MKTTETNDNPNTNFPPVAGFWHRFAAWLIDSLLIILAGQAVCLVFKPLLFQLGPYGRPIGLLFILPYFGLMNSVVFDGQTFGKRLMKIAVRGADNRPISVLRSLGRVSILALPFLLGGWPLPVLENPVAAVTAGLIVFGLGGSILYTMVFNRKAGQGIHDLICRTYVVQPDGYPADAFPITPGIHRVISAVWMGLTAFMLAFLMFDNPSYTPKPVTVQVRQLRQTLSVDPRFFTADVRDQTVTPENNPAYRGLVVDVWTVGELAEDERWETAVHITGIVLRDMKDIDEFDQIQVKLSDGYDIGIASYRSGFWYSNPVDEWQKILSENPEALE
ncbi:MAG: RDD family protein [Leptolinea sp.]|nr:RDD family protein [Leptolinea sp.]